MQSCTICAWPYGCLCHRWHLSTSSSSATHPSNIWSLGYRDFKTSHFLYQLERALRDLGVTEDREYTITGPEQCRLRDIEESVKSRSFKEQFPKFHAMEWEKQLNAQIIQGRQVYLSYFGACYRFSVAEGRVLIEEVEALVTNHEEADALICTHISHIARENASNRVVRASDTDVAVILLNHSEKIQGTYLNGDWNSIQEQQEVHRYNCNW